MCRFIHLLILVCFLYSSALYPQQACSKWLFSSTYLGGESIELFVMGLDEFGMVQHPNGDIYVCGPTESSNFPVTLNAFQPYYSGGSAESFVARLTPDLSRLVCSTYLGGSAIDIATGIAIDINGNICVAGHTTSEDFPVTSGAYDTSYVPSFWDEFDVFITILTPELDSVIASTYLGGSNPEYFNQIRVAVDSSGNIIVAGATLSWDFPVTPNAYCTTGGADTGPDAFISRLSPDLSELLASTYFKGDALEQVTDIKVNAENNICICGITGSADLPTTPNAYNTGFSGDGDVYLSVFGNDLDTLISSTFIGGGGFDDVFSMDFDVSGNIYICGFTESVDFPTTPGAYDPTFNYGFYDGYVSQLDGGLENLLASTFLGGSDWDFNRDLVFDPGSGDVFITGLAGGFDFPVTNHAYDTSFNGEADLFISRMSGDLDRLVASTFVGGEWDDFGLEVCLTEDGNVLVGGNTYSDDFPTTPGAYDETSNGSYDVTLTLIDKELSGQTVGIPGLAYPEQENEVILFPCSPNPFNMHTDIAFFTPETTRVSLVIYDLKGRKVISLLENQVSEGIHEVSWNGMGSNGIIVEKGTYIIQLLAGHQRQVQKVIRGLNPN